MLEEVKLLYCKKGWDTADIVNHTGLSAEQVSSLLEETERDWSCRDYILDTFSPATRRHHAYTAEKDKRAVESLFKNFPDVRFWIETDFEKDFAGVFSPAYLVHPVALKKLRGLWKQWRAGCVSNS